MRLVSKFTLLVCVLAASPAFAGLTEMRAAVVDRVLTVPNIAVVLAGAAWVALVRRRVTERPAQVAARPPGPADR